MPFTIRITRDFDHMSWVGAQLTEEVIAERQKGAGPFTLGLATGSSPSGLYKYLAKAFNAGRLDSRRIRTFNLDEYVGLPGGNPQERAMHPESYSFFMVAELFGLVHPRIVETNVPWGTLIDEAELKKALAAGEGFELAGADKGRAVVIARDADGYLGWIRDEILAAYAAKVRDAGGIDLHIIGVGGRGHVAFHESGIPFDSGDVLLVKLDDNTVHNAVADGHFARFEDSPQFAVSMSAPFTFEARRVLMLASGERKVGPVTEAVLGKVSTDNPLTYAQRYVAGGGDLTFLLTESAAAGLLERIDDVTARGIEVVDHRSEPAPRVGELAFVRADDTGLLG